MKREDDKVVEVEKQGMLELYVEGNKIKDSEGRDVFLFGCNTVGQGMAPEEGWDDWWTWAETDAEHIKNYGYNCVRLNPYWHQLEISTSPSDFRYNTVMFDNLEKAITAFHNQGLYVVLDVHATPRDLQVCSAFLPVTPEGNWSDAFFVDTSLSSGREHLRRLWLMISDRFENTSGILYDILNEPFHKGTMPEQEVADCWFDILDYVIGSLRAKGDSHICLASFTPWVENATFMRRKLEDPFVVYTPHFYPCIDWTTSPPSPMTTAIEDIRAALHDRMIPEKMQAFNVPWIAGEIGPWIEIDLGSDRETYVKNVLTVLNECRNIAGYLYWTYIQVGGEPYCRGWMHLVYGAAQQKITPISPLMSLAWLTSGLAPIITIGGVVAVQELKRAGVMP